MKNEIPLSLKYLSNKAVQSGHIQIGDLETVEQLKKMILERVKSINFENAKDDIRPFIKDQREIDIWSRDFFSQITESIKIV